MTITKLNFASSFDKDYNANMEISALMLMATMSWEFSNQTSYTNLERTSIRFACILVWLMYLRGHGKINWL